jgi:hypothetical protein
VPRKSVVDCRAGEPQALRLASVSRAAGPTSGPAVGLLTSFAEAGHGDRSFQPGPQCTGQVAALDTVERVPVEHRMSLAQPVAGRKSSVEQTVIATRNATAGQPVWNTAGLTNVLMNKIVEKVDERSVALRAAGKCTSEVRIAGQGTGALIVKTSTEAQQTERWHSAAEHGGSRCTAKPEGYASTQGQSGGRERVFASHLVLRPLE